MADRNRASRQLAHFVSSRCASEPRRALALRGRWWASRWMTGTTPASWSSFTQPHSTEALIGGERGRVCHKARDRFPVRPTAQQVHRLHRETEVVVKLADAIVA